MKKLSILFFVFILGCCLASGVSAADKGAIQKQVDDIVAAIDGGKMVDDFMDATNNKPYYIFIMEEAG